MDVLRVLIDQLLDMKDSADINVESLIEKRREIDEHLDLIVNAGNRREPFPLTFSISPYHPVSFSLEWETIHEFLPHELADDDELE